MPYCGHCGYEVSSDERFCSRCGCAVNQPPSMPCYPPYQAPPDVPNTGLNLLAFLIPIVGAILYLVKYQQYPIQAKEIGKWALIGYGIRLVLSTILGFLVFVISFLSSIW